ncbi:MAG TPA: hypothetical protein VGO57_02765 [Verrucomicrobiae bacterium]
MNRNSLWLYLPVAIGFTPFTNVTFAQTNNSSSLREGNSDNLVTPITLRQPAVSEINGKVDYAGGNMNSSAGNNFSASITLPVTHQFGFQADALYSRISDLNFFGGAGHFFWRNPGIGLLGLTGGYLHRDGGDSINTFQVGAEGEFYYKQFTFGFFSGVGSIDYQFPAPFIDTNPTRFVGRLSADYYPLENLRAGISFTSAYRDYFGRAEIEYQTPIDGLALTGEVTLGNHGYDDWLIGLRFYFGGKKTLRERQRQDDPPGLMSQILQSLGTYGAEFNKKENTWIAANPGSGDGGDGSYGVVTIMRTGPFNPIIEYHNPDGSLVPSGTVVSPRPPFTQLPNGIDGSRESNPH